MRWAYSTKVKKSGTKLIQFKTMHTYMPRNSYIYLSKALTYLHIPTTIPKNIFLDIYLDIR